MSSSGGASGGAALDPNAAHIAPVAAAQAAGAIGLGADSGHAHVGVHSLLAGMGLSVAPGAGEGDVTASFAPALLAMTYLPANVAITAAGTWTNALSEVIASGQTWLIFAQIAINEGTFLNSNIVAARLAFGATILAVETVTERSAASTYCMSLVALVTGDGATALTLDGYSNATTTCTIERNALSPNTNTYTFWLGIRVG